MTTLVYNTQTIRDEIVKIVCSIKKIKPSQLLRAKDFPELIFNILDVVNIILNLQHPRRGEYYSESSTSSTW